MAESYSLYSDFFLNEQFPAIMEGISAIFQFPEFGPYWLHNDDLYAYQFLFTTNATTAFDCLVNANRSIESRNDVGYNGNKQLCIAQTLAHQ